MPKYYALSYKTPSHLQIARASGILGVKFKKPQYIKGFNDLCPGDLVLLRNSQSKNELRFFGHCIVVDTPFTGGEPIWPDEIAKRQVLYPHRVRVDFDDVPHLPGLYAHSWKDWLNLGWITKKGVPYDKQALSLLLHGRYLPPPGHIKLASIGAIEQFVLFLS
jgi:hypothetical protein